MIAKELHPDPETEARIMATSRAIVETGVCPVCDCEVIPVPPLNLRRTARPHAYLCVVIGGFKA